MKKLVVLASGSGSNFQAIIDAVQNGKVKGEIAGLISNKKDAGAVQRATDNDIPVQVIPYTSENFFSGKLQKQLAEWKPDLIVLAGFLRKIPDDIIKQYPDKIINIHPSLLPKYGGKGFYGKKVHQAVLNAGEAASGCTVHFVNEEYDSGDIIRSAEVPVYPSDTADTLAARILEKEHQLLPSVIAHFINPKTN
ncbi:MAG: phosphoribosylglycinamide formyltransferase [Balneolaceae bacterium]